MTANLSFVLALATLLALILFWGLRVLPRENMQILASIPLRRREDGLWTAVNLTWYGVLQAVALVMGLAVALLLAGSAKVPLATTALVMSLLLATSLPAARLVARAVERRRGTFTVGGAVFVAALMLPLIVMIMNVVGYSGYALPLVSALAVAYPLGEGLGRLACISFGCCYGRRLDGCGPHLRAIFRRFPAVVVGPTRKAAYAGGCEGVPLVPMPALSAIVLNSAGMLGVWMFLAGSPRIAGVISSGVAFAWRFGSEFLRADYRGGGRFSAYQWMALACLATVSATLLSLPGIAELPEVARGLEAVLSPSVLLVLFGLGTAAFAYLGVSQVTSATIKLEVRPQ